MRKGTALVLVAVWTLPAACIDYRVAPQVDDTDQPDHTDVTDTAPQPDPDETCGDPVSKPPTAASIDESCRGEPALGALNVRRVWEQDAWPTLPEYDCVTSAKVARMSDVDGDGDMDEADPPVIVIQTGRHAFGVPVLRGLRADTGEELWAAQLGVMDYFALGDLDADGAPEIVLPATPIPGDEFGDQATAIVALDAAGTVLWQSEWFEPDELAVARPALADLDGDGLVEIVLGDILASFDGTILAQGGAGTGGQVGGGFAASFAMDVDGSSPAEIVAGNTLYAGDGSVLWESAYLDGMPAIADFDLDGVPEIVAISDERLRMFSLDGTFLWETHLPSNQVQGGLSPVLADYDGDGRPEIAAVSGTMLSVYEADGTMSWSMDLGAFGHTPVAYDFELDGVSELVVSDAETLRIVSGFDGTVRWSTTAFRNDSSEPGMTLADVDGDGSAEIIASRCDESGQYPGLAMYTTDGAPWAPATPVWNQHSFSVNNVDAFGGIPTSPTPSWESPNTFRSANLDPSPGLRAPDISMSMDGRCDLDCEEGRFRVWLHVCNGGIDALDAEAIVDVSVQVSGAETLLESRPVDVDLSPGECSEGLPFDVSSDDPTAIERLVFRVRHDVEDDCRASNDTLYWSGPFCPGN